MAGKTGRTGARGATRSGAWTGAVDMRPIWPVRADNERALSWLEGMAEEPAMFVAVYWWRVHPGREDRFREAWRRGAERMTAVYGSFGSRLHRNEDGRFVGYAEWPSE